MITLDFEKVAKSKWGVESIPLMQAVVFTMCGGGFIGRFAMTQPEKFYIDPRTSKFPYKKAEIEQAVECLAAIARANGLDANNLPEINFHNMGIF